jgi:hypothetical protein
MSDEDVPESQAFDNSQWANFRGIDDLRLEYSDLINVNWDVDAFHVVFGRFAPPFMLPPGKQADFWNQVRNEGFPAIPYCRLAIPPRAMLAMSEVIREQIRRFEEQYGPIDVGVSEELVKDAVDD